MSHKSQVESPKSRAEIGSSRRVGAWVCRASALLLLPTFDFWLSTFDFGLPTCLAAPATQPAAPLAPIQADTQWLSGFASRVVGTREHDQAVEQLRRRLKEYESQGVRVWTHEFRLVMPVVREAWLEVGPVVPAKEGEWAGREGEAPAEPHQVGPVAPANEGGVARTTATATNLYALVMPDAEGVERGASSVERGGGGGAGSVVPANADEHAPRSTPNAPRSTPALVLAVQFDGMSIVPELAPAADAALDSAVALSALDRLVRQRPARPVLLAFLDGFSIHQQGMRQMLGALSLTEDDRWDNVEEDRAQAREYAAHDALAADLEQRPDPLQFLCQTRYAPLHRYVKDEVARQVVEIESRLFPARLARLSATGEQLGELDPTIATLARQRARLFSAQTILLTDPQARDEHPDLTRQLWQQARQRLALQKAQLEQLLAVERQRQTLRRELVEALGLPGKQPPLAFVSGLDLSDAGAAVGPITYCRHLMADEVINSAPFRRWRVEVEKKEAAALWPGPWRRAVNLAAISSIEAGDAHSVGEYATLTSPAQYLGCPAITWATLDGLRTKVDTPLDTAANLDWRRIEPQLQATWALLERLIYRGDFKPAARSVPDWSRITGVIVDQAPGEPVPRLPISGYLTHLVPKDAGAVAGRPKGLPLVPGLRRQQFEFTGVDGRFRFDLLHRHADQNHDSYYVQSYLLGDDDALLRAVDLRKTGAGVFPTVNIKCRNITPMRAVVFSCRELDGVQYFDPRFLMGLPNGSIYDARKDTEPQRLNLTLYGGILSAQLEPDLRWELVLLGTYDPIALDAQVRDMDGRSLLPADYKAMSEEQRRVVRDTNLNLLSTEMESGAGGFEEEALPSLSSAAVAIVPAALLQGMRDGTLRSVAIPTADGAAAHKLALELSARLAFPIYYGAPAGEEKSEERRAWSVRDGPRARGRSTRHAPRPTLSPPAGARVIVSTPLLPQAPKSLLIPLIVGGLIIFNTMLSAIAERKKEVHVYTSLGLAPLHVGVLFLAEAVTYGLMGSIFGYVVGQGVATLLSKLGWMGGLTLNYSGTQAVMTMVLVLAVVVLSSLVPAYLAGKLAAPSNRMTWKVPAPKDDVIRDTLPFTVSAATAGGVIAFLYEYLDAHREGSIGHFATSGLSVERRAWSNAQVLRAWGLGACGGRMAVTLGNNTQTPDSAAPHQVPLAWAGWQMRVPEDWRPVRVEGSGAKGSMVLGDPHSSLMQITWSVIDDRRFDARRWLEKRLDGRAETKPGTKGWLGLRHREPASRDEAPAPHPGRNRGFADSAPGTQARLTGPSAGVFPVAGWITRDRLVRRGHCRIWCGYAPAARLLIEANLLRAAGDGALAALATLRVTPADRPTTSAVLSVSFESPAGFTLAESRLQLGDIALRFTAPPRRQLVLRQVYPASLALTRRRLARWLEFPAFPDRRLYRPGEQAHPVTVEFAGRAVSGLIQLGRRRPPLGWLGPRAACLAAAHDATLDRLLLVELEDTVAADSTLVRNMLAAMNRQTEAAETTV